MTTRHAFDPQSPDAARASRKARTAPGCLASTGHGAPGGARGGARRGTVTAGIVVALSFVAIVVATLGKPFLEIPGVVDSAAHATRDLDLEFLDGWDHPKIWYAPYTNTFGNIALFIPFGMSLYTLGQSLDRARFGLGGALLAGILLSLAIESAQWIFALGYTDVDDLLSNGLGAFIGGLLVVGASPHGRLAAVRRVGYAVTAALVGLLAALGAGIIG